MSQIHGIQLNSPSSSFCERPSLVHKRATKHQPSVESPDDTIALIVRLENTLNHISQQGRPTNFARVLMSMHELGAKTQDLLHMFEHLYHTTEPILYTPMIENVIHRDNWQDYLGQSKQYRSYLLFFENEAGRVGLNAVLEEYFYHQRLQQSIGGQLQPLVHTVFGIQRGFPELVIQGLAHLASSYIDVSDWLDDRLSPLQAYKDDHLPNILFDLVQADPRFSGRIDGYDTFDEALKILLKSKKELLQIYVAEAAKHPYDIRDLCSLALCLMQPSSHQTLDYHLNDGQLVESCLAIQTLKEYQGDVNQLLQLQFLVTLCIYLLQERPTPPPPPSPSCDVADSSILPWDVCIDNILSSRDANAILALRSVTKAQDLLDNSWNKTSSIATGLARFVDEQGVWIKKK